MRFFFYGTLLDPDLRRLLLPGPVGARPLLPAVLPGYRRRRSKHGCYPVIVRCRGGLVPGAVLDLEPSEALAVAYFEGPGFEPDVRSVIDETACRLDAWLFLPTTPRAADSRDWDLRVWQAREKRRQLAALKRWMREYGGRTLETPEIPWRMRRRLARA